ncbi:hypothetical protein Scep_030256 [Stephania cephalantha]|uniref:Uncharacterized protein n=1 Tax=Stephania cephalantha TaxID=152367 RepID=A0AAP0DZ77_9MAGN
MRRNSCWPCCTNGRVPRVVPLGRRESLEETAKKWETSMASISRQVHGSGPMCDKCVFLIHFSVDLQLRTRANCVKVMEECTGGGGVVSDIRRRSVTYSMVSVYPCRDSRSTARQSTSRYAFVLVHGVKLGRQRCRCASRASRRRGDPKLESRIYEEAQWRRAGRAAAAEKRSRGGGKGGGAAKIWGGGETEGTNGGGKRARAERCSADGVAFTRGDRRAEEKTSARRRRRIARGDATACVVGVRCERKERAGGVAVDDDDDSGRRRRWWWRGLCGGSEGFRWRWRRLSGLQREGTRRMGLWFYRFLCCDKSTTDQVICRRSSVIDSASIADKNKSVVDSSVICHRLRYRSPKDFFVDRSSQICHNLGGKFMSNGLSDARTVADLLLFSNRFCLAQFVDAIPPYSCSV